MDTKATSLKKVLDDLGVDKETQKTLSEKEKRQANAGRDAGIMACENLQNKTFSTRCH